MGGLVINSKFAPKILNHVWEKNFASYLGIELAHTRASKHTFWSLGHGGRTKTTLELSTWKFIFLIIIPYACITIKTVAEFRMIIARDEGIVLYGYTHTHRHQSIMCFPLYKLGLVVFSILTWTRKYSKSYNDRSIFRSNFLGLERSRNIYLGEKNVVSGARLMVCIGTFCPSWD